MSSELGPAPTAMDLDLVSGLTEAVTEAGNVLLGRYSPDNRVDDLTSLLDAIDGNDAAATEVLRPALELLRPGARWDDDEEGRGPLGAGEWWVADAAEGNVNHIHGRPDWAVTATLVRDGLPVVTAVILPVLGQTFTAVRGGGAYLNSRPINVSQKTDLAAALVGTGQAKPGESAHVHRAMSASIDRMLESALLVSATVPATLQLVQVAAGRLDAFWQYGQIRSGLLAGALLVQEAHGAVTDLTGTPWRLGSRDFLATTPGLVEAITSKLAR